jgi:hypothetical protein
MPHLPLRAAGWTTVLLLIAIALGLVLHFRRHIFEPKPIALPAAAMASGGRAEPQLMLWAWETPEDLTAIDPATAGVAYLALEVLIGSNTAAAGQPAKIEIRPRLQPLRTTPGTFLMAVVRIEVSPDFAAAQASPQFIRDTAQAIVAAARPPSVRALQVDFDATASQRGFYVKLLRQIRTDLRPELPLSMTALVSWCSKPSWLEQLPAHTVDEAVPMFFRMGGPAGARATAPKTWSVTEPLCAGSVGLATDETWPDLMTASAATSAQQRVYLFRPGPWSAIDVAKLNAHGYRGIR